MFSTKPAPVSAIPLAHGRGAEDPAKLLHRDWTKTQLQAVAEVDRRVQRHPQHMLARMALANHGNSSDVALIRASVARSLGGAAGTHYIVAALHLAHLALTFPYALSPSQRALLLAPLESAEVAQEAVNNASSDAEIAA